MPSLTLPSFSPPSLSLQPLAERFSRGVDRLRATASGFSESAFALPIAAIAILAGLTWLICRILNKVKPRFAMPRLPLGQSAEPARRGPPTTWANGAAAAPTAPNSFVPSFESFRKSLPFGAASDYRQLVEPMRTPSPQKDGRQWAWEVEEAALARPNPAPLMEPSPPVDPRFDIALLSVDRARAAPKVMQEPLRNRYVSPALKFVMAQPLNIPRSESFFPLPKRDPSLPRSAMTPSRMVVDLSPRRTSDEALANVRRKLRKVGKETGSPRNTARCVCPTPLSTPSARSLSRGLEDARQKLRRTEVSPVNKSGDWRGEDPDGELPFLA